MFTRGIFFTLLSIALTHAAVPDSSLLMRSGDRSVVLHWTPTDSSTIYQLQRSAADAPLRRIATLTNSHFVDFDVTNGVTYRYFIQPVNSTATVPAQLTGTATPRVLNGEEFLKYQQLLAFDYFWFESNPRNGLVRDRSRGDSFSSIAAVGFGITALGIAAEQGWISRFEAATRTLITLRTFADGSQGPEADGRIGHRGWFYHFLNMETAVRTNQCELSSIDTALLLGGVLSARQYFNRTNDLEQQLRATADAIYNRVDWAWMLDGKETIGHGWVPGAGFLKHRWEGYNEAMILYILALGATNHSVPASTWQAWTKTYEWKKSFGMEFVHFEPLFGHQYSHCWIDFRSINDAYMRGRGITYFENSRRATLAQKAYAAANSQGPKGYGSNLWGFTASDGPGFGKYMGYSARGTPPPFNDDGTIAPTAAGGSLPFAPAECLAVLSNIYERFRTKAWTPYGFCDAFNLEANWFDPEVLGIDQGPILIMAENHLTGSVWKRMMAAPEIQRGLQRAGFSPTGNRP